MNPSGASTSSTTSPIVNVHLKWSAPVMTHDFAVVLDPFVQYIFNRTRLHRWSGDAAVGHLLAQRRPRNCRTPAGADRRSQRRRHAPRAAPRRRSRSAGRPRGQRDRGDLSPSARASSLTASARAPQSPTSPSPAPGPTPAGPPRWNPPSAAATPPPPSSHSHDPTSQRAQRQPLRAPIRLQPRRPGWTNHRRAPPRTLRPNSDPTRSLMKGASKARNHPDPISPRSAGGDVTQ